MSSYDYNIFALLHVINHVVCDHRNYIEIFFFFKKKKRIYYNNKMKIANHNRKRYRLFIN
jgi:hypothetical protein